jgi:DNA-directed RNA polymerase specialized sigma24 family protein
LLSLLRARDREQRKLTGLRPAPLPKPRPPRLTVSQVADLVAAYEAGSGTQDLAARFGVTRSAVSAQLTKAGVLRPAAKLTVAQIDEAVQLRAENMFYRQIAEGFGVDTETVRRAVLKRHASAD